MSIKLSGFLPLAAYAVQTKVTASLQAKANTSAKSSPALATPAKSTSVARTVAPKADTFSSSQSPVNVNQPKGSVGTTYTSDKQVVTNTQIIGSKLDVSVAATTLSSGSIGPSVATTAPHTSSSISDQTLTPNEQILLAKQLYDNAHKLGSQAGMATASELADQARQNGGTISSNVTLEQAKVMVANEQILKSKEEYDIALKAGNEAAMKASSEQAAQARKNGGSISSNVTLEQAKVIVANEQIVQAKKDYAVAEKKEDIAAMNVAKETANKARQSGGTISSNVTLEYALKILDQSKWNVSDRSSPMDVISREDEASLMKEAREKVSKFGMDEQIAQLNRTIIDLNTAILTLEASNKSVKETIESLKQQKEELQEDRKRLLELGEWIDALQEDIEGELEATNKVITELSDLLEQEKLSSERVLKLVESIHEASDEQRGTVLGEAMSGFFSGIWSSLDDTVDLVFFAFEDPQAVGKQIINGVGDTVQSLWDKLSDPKATYNDVEQSIKEFMELSDEEQAYTVGFLLSQLSPSRRTDILNPMKNKDDGANGIEGNSSSGKVKDGNGVEGAGNGGKKSFVDDPLDETGKLKPDVKYKTGEHQYDYETDHLGRIEKFSANDLKLTARDDRLPHDPKTPGKESGDHAGHLAGDRFGGSSEIDNLVSQSSKVNLSEYKKIENEWARALSADPPKHVSVDVKINYDGDSLRPSGFKVTYEIDGRIKVVDLVN